MGIKDRLQDAGDNLKDKGQDAMGGDQNDTQLQEDRDLFEDQDNPM